MRAPARPPAVLLPLSGLEETLSSSLGFATCVIMDVLSMETSCRVQPSARTVALLQSSAANITGSARDSPRGRGVHSPDAAAVRNHLQQSRLTRCVQSHSLTTFHGGGRARGGRGRGGKKRRGEESKNQSTKCSRMWTGGVCGDEEDRGRVHQSRIRILCVCAAVFAGISPRLLLLQPPLRTRTHVYCVCVSVGGWVFTQRWRPSCRPNCRSSSPTTTTAAATATRRCVSNALPESFTTGCCHSFY